MSLKFYEFATEDKVDSEDKEIARQRYSEESLYCFAEHLVRDNTKCIFTICETTFHSSVRRSYSPKDFRSPTKSSRCTGPDFPPKQRTKCGFYGSYF
ncbi:hypothetical protein CDAR_515731 [Caerostris darwini]|uniref:Uncharacterized protein n=1 Tax=Caerostris darwini TaxID=1538125 RepID=A0AAV4RZY7_9ARAC|nr:hypothetical protein CDAR_515731 [Caerostris darwini]